MSLTVPTQVEVDGRTWRLFAFSYQTTDGAFTGSLYALSHEHALLMLEELKATATLDGEIGEVMPV